MLDSIQESYIKQSTEQGSQILSSEDRNYLSSLQWEDTVEGDLFWRILYLSYSMYGTYDYGTLIKLYIRFDSVRNYIPILGIYYDYFDKEKGTLTDEGFENLLKKIGKC